MKWLAIQTPGANPQNKEFGRGWQRALIRAGREVQDYGPGCGPLPKCDAIIHLVDYRGEWVPDLSKVRALKVAVFMDSHLNLKGTLQSCARHKFDYVVTNVWQCKKDYKPFARKRAMWMPNALDPTLIGKRDVAKTVPVGFCGNIANRLGWIADLRGCPEVQMRFDCGVVGEDMVRTINSYRIHWNRNVSYDINCRTFETTACGTMLLTNDTPVLRDCFGIGSQVVTYGDYRDCLEKIGYYMLHGQERDDIAAAGYKQAMEQHTYDRRVQQLMGLIP